MFYGKSHIEKPVQRYIPNEKSNQKEIKIIKTQNRFILITLSLHSLYIFISLDKQCQINHLTNIHNNYI